MPLNKLKAARFSLYIPLLFGVIILGFVAKLWNDNINLLERNTSLRAAFIDANARNGTLAESLTPITQRLDRLSKTLDDESRRRSVAEASADALQKENAFLRSSKQCSISIDPSAVKNGADESGALIIQAAPAGKP